MNSDNNFASVGVIVKRENKVLLVRHTYGSANGKLLNPGGFLQIGEMPFDAAVREVLEETGVNINPIGFLGIRCEAKCWYMIILAEYVSGEPRTDEKENCEALFMDIDEALSNPTVTNTAKRLIGLSLENTPIIPKDADKGRILFA